ncbi:MAG: cytochrome b/b6 domain-containing protein [Nitrospirota bacterium]
MKRIYLHPIPVRVWHWINAACFILLIITGIQMRYVDYIRLFSFETAVDIHSWTGFILIANYLIWLSFYVFTLKIKIYIPTLNPIKFAKESITQALFYGYGIFVGNPNPHHPTPDNKFNPMQKVAYLMIMALLIPVQIITGLLLWDPKFFSKFVNLLGGIRIVDTIHVVLFIFFTAFIFVHLYLATLGHTTFAHIKAMFTGYEEEEEEHAH